MIAISATPRRARAFGVLAVVSISLLAGCGGGGGGGDSGGGGGSAPVVTSISPATGAATGGTIVTITGSNFGSSSGGLSVKFGNTSAAGVTYVSSNTVKAVAPPGSGKVDVTVTTIFATSAATAGDKFTYSTDGPPPPPPI